MATASQDLSSEPSLIQRALAAEPEAWKTLVQLYSPMIYQWARSCGMSQADAANLTEYVFKSAWKCLKSSPQRLPKSSFRTWLRGFVFDAGEAMSSNGPSFPILKNVVRQFQRPDDELTGPDQFAVEMFEQLPQCCLSLIKATVDETTWKAFSDVVVQGQSETAVAVSLHLSTVTVRQAKYQVLFRLRAMMQDH